MNLCPPTNVSFHLQLASTLPPDRHTPPAGDAGLHANALCNVLQRVDLPGGHHWICLGILSGFSSTEAHLRRDERMKTRGGISKCSSESTVDSRSGATGNIFDFMMPGLCGHDQQDMQRGMILIFNI